MTDEADRTTGGAGSAFNSTSASSVGGDSSSGGSTGTSEAVKLPALSVPKGGGAVHSIGEKLSANPATGTASMTIPIATSPGRPGFGVGLSLGYDSGAGNGPFGLGWRLSAPSITRKTDKGLPRYVDDAESDVFILSGAEDLVPVVHDGRLDERQRGGYTVRRYRPRVEGDFARIERWTDRATGEIHWRATTADNVTSLYGRSAGARVADPSDPSRVFGWLLEETRDDRGNFAVFEYKAEDGAGVDPVTASESGRFEHADGGHGTFCATAQRYLKRVLYGNSRPGVRGGWMFEAVLDYGEHRDRAPTPEETQPWSVRRDPFSSYRPGFEVRTYRLCRRVLMFHHFEELGARPCLVSSTDFEHEQRDHLTLLKRVLHVGYAPGPEGGRDDYERAESPPLELSYTLRELHSELKSLEPHSLVGIPGGVDGRMVRWVDLDGEGIAGALIADERGWRYKANLGDGHLADPVVLPTLPVPADLRRGVQTLSDLASEGHLDLVQFAPPVEGYFTRTSEGGWSAFRSLRSIPRIDWADPNLRFLDVDGDGLTDLLLTEDQAIVWYRSLGKEGFGGPEIVRKPLDEARGPAVVFADGTETIFVADMSGDGLVDIVRVRNTEVCYWPNLGYGRFGGKVTLDGAPRFDSPDGFDPRRVHLADVDGSGTADLVYLGGGGVTVYFNESGNRLATPVRLELPIPHRGVTIDLVDLLGHGTACVVWSCSLPGDAARPVAYVDLMGGTKPHLLSRFTNGVGGETRLAYASSTEHYLRDKREGKPWLTRLAYPVQVLDRLEYVDHVAESKLVTRYRYHHGFYDGVEREYRGFAYVEQWDAEAFEGGTGNGLFSEVAGRCDGELRVPPVHTKTWFHTGAWLARRPLEQELAEEYYALDPSARPLPPTCLPAGLRSSDEREAARALRGSILRQEVYADDGTPRSVHPYCVSQRTYVVRALQPVEGRRHGVFFVHGRDQLDLAYERDPRDPRSQHQLVLEVDDFGRVTLAASIAYARRAPREPEQARAWATVTTASFFHHPDADGWYRLGIPIESATSELTGLEPGRLFSVEDIRERLGVAREIPYEAKPTGGLERRIVRRKRKTYYREDLSDALPLGDVASHALVYQTYLAAFTPGLLAEAYGSLVDRSVLRDEGGYLEQDGFWWAPSGRAIYARDQFLQPVEAVDPFGNHSFVRYDRHALVVVETEDALANKVVAAYDYRVLAPRLVTDANENRVAIAFDARGLAVRIALMGKEGAGEGDTLEDPTQRFQYDPLRYARTGGEQPVFAHSLSREEHGPANRRWLETYSYSDGSGRPAMQKVRAPEGRWIGSGRVVLDNKGNAVKQYEPFFSSTNGYETERQLRESGVTSILRYDPLGRHVRTDFPDGSFQRIELDAWGHVAWDRNDTVLNSRWFQVRGAPEPHGPEPGDDGRRRAAWLAAQHADTPSRTHLDALGRVFLGEDDNRDGGTLYRTRSELDVAGHALAITDARGIRALDGARFDLLGRLVFARSSDAGERRALADAAGKPLRTVDARGVAARFSYDALGRTTHVFARLASGSEVLVARSFYGEAVQDAVDRNLRTRAYRSYDGAGVATSDAYDFKGNLLRASRRLARDYRETVDWSSIAAIGDMGSVEDAARAALEPTDLVATTTYDALNRTVSSVTPDGSDTRVAYDETGLVARIECAVRGAERVTSFVDAVQYNARGQRIRVTRGNGIVSTFRYEPETFRLEHLVTTRADGRSLQSLRYEYDPVGNVVAVGDGVSFGNPGVSGGALYVYDPLYRLTSAAGREHPGQQPTFHDAELLSLAHEDDHQLLRPYHETYRYDSVGNALATAHRSGHGASAGRWVRALGYARDSNRLLTLGAGEGDEPESRFEYDAAGNVTSMPHLAALEWDYAGRLSAADRRGGGRVFFSYGANGARVRKVYEHDNLVEERIYAGLFEIYRRSRVGRDAPEFERESLHIVDLNRRIAIVETKTIDAEELAAPPAPRVRYQLDNHLSSSLMEVDEEARVISYEEYFPFGSTAFRTARNGCDGSPKRYRYTGQERDEETGFYYHGARYLATWLSRWTSPDPAGFVNGTNIYAYVGNNPVGATDPTGLDDEPRVASTMDRDDPSNYVTFDDYRAGAASPWSTEYLKQRWDEAHAQNPADPTPTPAPTPSSSDGGGSVPMINTGMAEYFGGPLAHFMAHPPEITFRAKSFGIGIVNEITSTIVGLAKLSEPPAISSLRQITGETDPLDSVSEAVHIDEPPIYSQGVIDLGGVAGHATVIVVTIVATSGEGALEEGAVFTEARVGGATAETGEALAARLQARAEALNALRAGKTPQLGTTAVMAVRNTVTGEVRTLVAVEHEFNEARVISNLAPGEEFFVKGAGHAEQTILTGVRTLGPEWEVVAGGASRNVCTISGCAWLLGKAGLGLGGTEFEMLRAGQTPFRMFWR